MDTQFGMYVISPETNGKRITMRIMVRHQETTCKCQAMLENYKSMKFRFWWESSSKIYIKKKSNKIKTINSTNEEKKNEEIKAFLVKLVVEGVTFSFDDITAAAECTDNSICSWIRIMQRV